MWGLRLLLSSLLITSALSQNPSQFNCGETFCTNQHLQSPCPEKRNCTTQGTRSYLTPIKCNCCEGSFCIEYLEEGAQCDVDGLPAFVDLCGPTLACNPATRRCAPITNTKCMREVLSYDQNFKEGTVGTSQFKPSCDAVGRYTNRQCLPGSVCFCVNTEGQRIFGLGLVTTAMNCKCARDIDNLKMRNGIKGLMPRCLPNGDYDELQCVGRDCWCIYRPERKVKINDIDDLPCYNKELHPIQPIPYRRACENARSEIELEHLEAKAEARLSLISDQPRCDPDGFFSPVQSQNDKLICVDRYNNRIRNYEISKTSPLADKVDCYCARLEQLLANNVNGRPVCCKHGNFRKWQCSGSLCYCVDRDGKQIVKAGSDVNEVHKDELNQLPCYQNAEDDCIY